MSLDEFQEQTLVLIKPDGVKRGLTGKILARFEEAGLKIVALKMVQASRQFVENHYPNTPEWIRGMGQKTLGSYRNEGKDPFEEVGTDDPMAIGEMIKQWNIDYLTSGPIVAVVLQGVHAINVVRKMCGNTIPFNAEPGTIRGDFSTASPIIANALKTSIKNLIHAAGNPQEAKHEIRHWFPESDFCDYRRTDEVVMF
ncbi:MAG: nucleoside-diphosphate kinase [Anaerolineae bacterium]